MSSDGITATPQAGVPPIRKILRGPAYREFVRIVTVLKRARSYLEIGVHNGSSIAGVNCASIGVDPKFVFDRSPMGQKPSLHLYHMTSDDYFKDNDPRDIFGGPVDVAFLDGLHLFEFLLRDFINAERVCSPGSIILMDDCLPINAEMAERDHRPELRQDKEVAAWWAGDCWKVVEILREYRPDLTLTPVDVMPTGSIAVTNLDPGSDRLQTAYEEIVSRWRDVEMTSERLEQHWEANAPVSMPDAIGQLFPNISVQRVEPGQVVAGS
jgi:hypothetical protein